MKRKLGVVALVFVGLIGVAIAAENPAGTWKWTERRGDQDRERTATFKLDGDKLTGTISGRDNAQNPISDASYKDGKISFSYTQEFGGNKVTRKYAGTVSGDTITGKIEGERDGQKTSADWNAKRQK
jgi:hypothetical protein